jgi:hypothetical protein
VPRGFDFVTVFDIDGHPIFPINGQVAYCVDDERARDAVEYLSSAGDGFEAQSDSKMRFTNACFAGDMERFPEDFMPQLTTEEWTRLRSQIQAVS